MTLVFALLVTQGIHLVRGEAAEALALGDEIVALCREYGLPQEREWSRSFQGAALAALGRLDEGIEQLATASPCSARSAPAWCAARSSRVLADLLRFAGRVDEGCARSSEGFAHAEQHGEGGYLAELHRREASCCGCTGTIAGAEASFAAAIEYARGQQATIVRAARRDRLGAAADRVRPSAPSARAVLEPVYDWFTEGLGTADLAAARATLDQVR